MRRISTLVVSEDVVDRLCTESHSNGDDRVGKLAPVEACKNA
jgi:hypothetical protein